ncbi:MAG: IS66 family transposase zinc-finger binding domain-containing protein [Clostridia bacterium]|nr:IS66 family transposase zinc-finger binding domain-containing protein [Clostridia bacterium]MDY4009264.1 IS66 family transposase zinc-finger binding domain-containing protein [Candidatus Limiplasma sp.]
MVTGGVRFSERERICDECGHMLQEIGKEVRRTLQIVPAQVRIRH